MVKMVQEPGQFFCLRPPPKGTSQRGCEEHIRASLEEAASLGAKLVDVTDVAKLEILGTAVGFRRSEFVFALRFGVVGDHKGNSYADSSPAAVRRACERMLLSSRVGYVDLFYQERFDPKTPLERTMWVLKELVMEGKVRHLGLAVNNTDLLERACKIHPVASVCLEWSLWKPRGLDKVVRVARQHGLAILAKDPLGGLENLPIALDAMQDAKTVSGKVCDLLQKQSTVLLCKAKDIAECPGEDLESKIMAAAAGQDHELTTSLSSLLDDQLRRVLEDLQAHGDWATSVNTVKVAMVKRNASYIGKAITIAVNQRKRLLKKMDEWVGKLHCDGASICAFKNLVHAQKKHFVTRLTNIRAVQNNKLRDAGLRASDDSEFHQVLGDLLSRETGTIIHWVTAKKEELAVNLIHMLHDLRRFWMSSAKEELLKLRKEQNLQVLEDLAPLLGGKTKLFETVENVVHTHANIFEASLTEKDFGHKPQAMINKIEKLAEQESNDMEQRLEAVMQDRNLFVTGQKGTHRRYSSNALKCTSLHARGDVDIGSIVSDRVRDIARQRGCDERQVALAWMTSQGDDVLPMVPVKGPHEMASVVEGTRMALTDEEMITLYAGD